MLLKYFSMWSTYCTRRNKIMLEHMLLSFSQFMTNLESGRTKNYLMWFSKVSVRVVRTLRSSTKLFVFRPEPLLYVMVWSHNMVMLQLHCSRDPCDAPLQKTWWLDLSKENGRMTMFLFILFSWEGGGHIVDVKTYISIVDGFLLLSMAWFLVIYISELKMSGVGKQCGLENFVCQWSQASNRVELSEEGQVGVFVFLESSLTSFENEKFTSMSNTDSSRDLHKLHMPRLIFPIFNRLFHVSILFFRASQKKHLDLRGACSL